MPPAGLVTIEAAVTANIATAGRWVRAVVYKNLAEFKRGTQVSVNVPGDTTSVIAFVDETDGTDVYQLYVHHNNNMAIAVTPIATYLTYFSGSHVGIICEE